MLIEAIGAVIPLALAVALSPFPVIAIVLLVSGPHGRRNGSLFAAGWLVGLTVVGALVMVLLDPAGESDSTSAALADWLRVLAGAGLAVAGVRKGWTGMRADEAKVPGWMASLEDASAGRSLALGLLLSAANPKNLVLTASAAAVIVVAGADGSDLVIALVAFVLVASCTVVGAVVAGAVGGTRTAAALDGVRRFMVANNAVITMIVMVLIGASVLGDGLAALAR